MNTFNFTQETPATEWAITHNLGSYVVSEINVLNNGVYTVILPEQVEYVDENTIRVHFTSAREGFARLVGAYTFKMNTSLMDEF